MMSAAAKPMTAIDGKASPQASYRLAGLLIVSLFPAMFWTILLAAGGFALGYPLSPLALATIGAAIAAVLAAVYNALFARL